MPREEQTFQQTVDEFKGRAGGKSIVDYGFTPIINRYTEEIPAMIERGIPSCRVFMYYDWAIPDCKLQPALDTISTLGTILSVYFENAR